MTDAGELVLVDEDETYRAKKNTGAAESALDTCNLAMMVHTHDDIVGIDLTRLTSSIGWCYTADHNQITDLGNGSAIGWAQWDGWTVDSVTDLSYWIESPTIGEHLAHGMYHWILGDSFHHNLENTIRVFSGGFATCSDDHWGSFAPQSDIDVICSW